MRIINIVNFGEWIWEKFYEWRGKSTKGVSEFAKHLGVKQPTVSAWMKGEYGPRGENLKRIAEKYPDVYAVLGLPMPEQATDPDLARLDEMAKNLSLEQRQAFVEAMLDWLRNNGFDVIEE
jgi:transcriptional regulator with XRE-family HTH domain